MRLLAITPPAAVAPELDSALVDAWVEGGADAGQLAVLLREPGASARAILGDARFRHLRLALARHELPTLVSVDPRQHEPEVLAPILARAQPALAGVQLRGDPSPDVVQRWREVLGDAALIGRSVHGLEPHPCPAASYTCLAPIFAPRTRLPGDRKRPIGLEGLRRWSSSTPGLLALGGVSTANAPTCLAAGAVGVAGIRLFFGRSDEAGHNVAALVAALAAAPPRVSDVSPPSG